MFHSVATNGIFPLPSERALVGTPIVPDDQRTAQHEAARLTELVANEVSGVVLRSLCRSSLDWMSRALFGDSRSLQDLFDQGLPHAPNNNASQATLPALQSLLGQPVETSPFVDVAFPDYNNRDRRIDNERLLYTPLHKDFCFTGPEYWLQRFLVPDEQSLPKTLPENWMQYSPMGEAQRLAQRLDPGRVRLHFLGQHDGIFAGILHSGFGPDDRFAEGAALLLSWGVLHASVQHWYHTMHRNLLGLRKALSRFQLALDATTGELVDASIDQALAKVLADQQLLPLVELQKKRPTGVERLRSRAVRPIEQYAGFDDAKASLPEDGDSAKGTMFRLVAVFQATAREELQLLDLLCSRLAEDTRRYFCGLSGAGEQALQGMFGDWPTVPGRVAIDNLSSWAASAASYSIPDSATGLFAQGAQDRAYWTNRMDEELGRAGWWAAGNNWSRYLSGLLAMFEARVLQRLRPRNAERIGGSQFDREVGAGRPQREVSAGLAREIARNFTEVDCSQEEKRGGQLPPGDQIRFQASRFRLMAELSEAFSRLEGYRHAPDSTVVDMSAVQHTQDVFGTASDYLRSAPVRTDASLPHDNRSDGLLGLDMDGYYRAVCHEADKAANSPDYQPSTSENLSSELTRLKNRVPASKATAAFVGITDILRTSRAFQLKFKETEEPDAQIDPSYPQILQAVSELKSRVRVQRAFWTSPVIPDDVRLHNTTYWSDLDGKMDRAALLVQNKAFVAGWWEDLYNLIAQRMVRVLTSAVLYTIQNIEYEAAGMGDQATVDDTLATDGVYSLLRRGFAGGKQSPWDRVIRSRRQQHTSHAMYQYTSTEQRVSELKVTNRQRVWCREARDHVLQHIRRSNTLRVESMQYETRTGGVNHARVDQWERDLLRSLDELRRNSRQGDGVQQDSAQALHLFSLAQPAPFYTDCDTIVLGLKVPQSSPFHDELVQEIKEKRHYSAELDALLRRCDRDLNSVLVGVEGMRQASQYAESYFLWASFDPLAVAPVQDFDAAAPGHTFFFQVRLYRTVEFYYQWLALGYSTALADAALKFRREALRLYEQTPYVATGEYDRPSAELAILGQKPAAPEKVVLGGPRFYRTLYQLQDLGCTSSTSYRQRKNIGVRDAWREYDASVDAWTGIPMPCHDGQGAASDERLQTQSYAEAYGEWHDRLVRSGAILANLARDSGSRKNFHNNGLPPPFF